MPIMMVTLLNMPQVAAQLEWQLKDTGALIYCFLSQASITAVTWLKPYRSAAVNVWIKVKQIMDVDCFVTHLLFTSFTRILNASPDEPLEYS